MVELAIFYWTIDNAAIWNMIKNSMKLWILIYHHKKYMVYIKYKCVFSQQQKKSINVYAMMPSMASM